MLAGEEHEVGQLTEIRRYPVKSLAGERLEMAEIDARGVVGDRRWAVIDEADGGLGSGKTSRRFRRMDGLLQVAAELGAAGPPRLTFPDGQSFAADEPDASTAMTALVGRPVSLASEAHVSHFDEGPLHLVTSAAMASLAAAVRRPVSTARLRGNLLVDVADADGIVEDAWVGRELRLGDEVVVHVRARMVRCVMVEHAQRELPAMPGLLGAIGTLNDACLGVVADVLRPGRVHLGDAVRVIDG